MSGVVPRYRALGHSHTPINSVPGSAEALIMAWSPETIIALVTLLVTSPSTLLLVWKYIRRRRKRCVCDTLERAESFCISTPSSNRRPTHCTLGHLEIILGMGPYREGILMQTYTHVPPRNSMTRPWPSYCCHEQRCEISPASTARPVREWD
ncbi:hypothetical protein BDV35DRAFT_335696 [Aspergillus flavus]|uniref:Uncharacterized protein n=1 Tax=Aspergillus flavus TaxID=5059 RepID=A0A5N6HFZ8_ASPFL|nr:hypothetical protein BDV35DRAFT_335696 [Aspergillus flavus]